MIQQALERSEAIDVLINVLEADDHKCKVYRTFLQLYKSD